MTVQVLIPWRNTGCPHRWKAFMWCCRRWAALHPKWEIVEGRSPSGPFNVGAALNDAMSKATADVVLLMGADTFLDTDIINEAVAESALGEWVLPADVLVRFTEEATATILARNVDGPLVGHNHRQADNQYRGWGPVIGPLEALRAVPYDERFKGWGGEDEAACIARTTLLGPPARLPGNAYMLWHPPVPYHANYPRNLALLDRYDEAAGDPAALLALACEARGLVPAS